MNKVQEIKMRLLEKFGITDDARTIGFCREAYKFLTEDNEQEAKNEQVLSAGAAPVAVDLGLPSGTLWCDRNVGATSPEDDGAFFSWGNPEPHYPKHTENDWGDDEGVFETDVFNFDAYDKSEGAQIDGDIDAAHDAATVNMGENWKMPTEKQFVELYEHCTWQRKTVNGKNGYLVTSKKNGNSIFFSCSGVGYGLTWEDRGTYGLYWSSAWMSARYARSLSFNSGGVDPQNYSNRYSGFALRPVQKT